MGVSRRILAVNLRVLTETEVATVRVDSGWLLPRGWFFA